MAKIVAQLLVIMAVLFMPLGMAAAPAAAAQHHGAAASMPAEHCPDASSEEDADQGFAQCTMACSAALPAFDHGQAKSTWIVCTPVHPGVAHRLRSVQPEIATPPPKRS